MFEVMYYMTLTGTRLAPVILLSTLYGRMEKERPSS
jgi:hypothetical protein